MASSVEQWVDEMARQTRPDHIVWCDGSEEENERLVGEMLADGTLQALDDDVHPDSYLHRSSPTDVARTEHLTFICSPTPELAGPNNNWMSPADARERVWPLFDRAMSGRTMYVVPYLMGPAESPYSKIGVELTDSPYVVANMRMMTRMGQVATDRLNAGAEDWVPGLHSTGDLSPDRRFIMHFPEERTIWSVGSGYGGNALLGKKCFSLRIASTMGRDQGWMAEHMLILELRAPDGDVMYIAGAFPSACGKTNLAMLKSPFEAEGWSVRTVGDDICWINIGPDGRFWAINPENGYFGVAPGTNYSTNPNAMATVKSNTIFTNVAVTEDGRVWWEGMDGTPPPHLIDWQGQPWTPGVGSPAAHPNSRFTTPASQNPALSPHWEDAQGVPLSAILFGGRRSTAIPLVFQTLGWEHGVYVGAMMGSETTAAATGAVGVLRHDPMSMLPFCGYNMADYWGHWLEMGRRASQPPAIFHVNWFRRDADGHFLWPGFGQNMRVLRWIHDQVKGGASGRSRETPIGIMPTPEAVGAGDAGLTPAQAELLFRVDPNEWRKEAEDHAQYLAQYGDRVPSELHAQQRALVQRLG
ncbi:MAG: phosphoenolpyruvate carboxykinase [Chloroflexota bacterium]|jgi:phosphoenolpyruvate carboxykinase (GTP)|nr:phosphoenolpyruvate carboxykinase [Chloroflexota bacterium]